MVNAMDIKKGVIGAIIISIFILAFFIIKPIIVPILFGLLFAYIFDPIYKKIQAKIKRENISAFIVLFGIVTIIAAPIVYFTPILIRQTSETYILLQNFNLNEFLNIFLHSSLSTSISENMSNLIYNISVALQNQFINIIVNFPSIFLQFIVFLFTFFFAIRDASEMKAYISTLSPFSEATEEKILKEFRGITNAIVLGQVFIGILQGLAIGIGLFFLGIPKVLILTFAAIIVSIIPVIGSWIVWLPVGLVLLINGQTFSGAFFLLYGALFVSTIDNLIRPYLLTRQSNLPVALSIIGIIGGLYFFGIAGLLLGPLVLAYVLIIIEFYQKDKLKDLFNK